MCGVMPSYKHIAPPEQRPGVTDRLFVKSLTNNTLIACDMTAIPRDQRPGHLTTSRQLFARIEEFREVADGYEFRFASGPDLLMKLAKFVSLEKLCCPFLTFVIEVVPENGPVWLRLTGRDGVKTFIREEISGLPRNSIKW
jgi:hypothetical protein